MGLIDTLCQFGFDREADAKMARHKDNRPLVRWTELLAFPDKFEEYQSWQAHPVFHDVDFVVSFIGVTPRRADFYGVYRVLGHELVPFRKLPEPKLWPWKAKTAHHRYHLERLPQYEPLTARLVIEWNGERKWWQHLRDYAVLECPAAFDTDDPMWSAREGQLSEVQYLRKERNRSIVLRRKQHDDHTCKACGFKLMVDGQFIIDCHHLKPFRDADERITSVRDLVCLCPTCHRIAHAGRKPLSIAAIRKLRGLA